MGSIRKECMSCLVVQHVQDDDRFCSKCGFPYAKIDSTTSSAARAPTVDSQESAQPSETEQTSAVSEPFKKLSLFGGKIGTSLLDFGKSAASTVSTTAKTTASVVSTNASAAADHIQGRVAPSTMNKAGFLSKFYLPQPVYRPAAPASPQIPRAASLQPPSAPPATDVSEWTDHYFALKDGGLHVLPYPDAERSDVSLGLEHVLDIKTVDTLVTGRPNSFIVTITLPDDTDPSMLQFFGAKSTQDKKISLILSAATKEDAESWVRELSSAVDGVKIKRKAGQLGNSALDLGMRVTTNTFATITGTRVAQKMANAATK